MKPNIILLLGAKSSDKPLNSVPAELAAIKQLFANVDHLKPQIEYEPYLTLPMLGDLLRQLTDQVGILHFAGHSNSTEIQTDSESIHTQHIASILKTWDRRPALIFLNGCNSAGQVESFLGAGVSCVIATHQPIDDKQAATFAYEFYANLLSDLGKVTAEDAFNRAGAIVLMGSSFQPRSLDIDRLCQNAGKPDYWDWGLFTRDTTWSQRWVLEDVFPRAVVKQDQVNSIMKNINSGQLNAGGEITIGDSGDQSDFYSTDDKFILAKNINKGIITAGSSVVIGDKK